MDESAKEQKDYVVEDVLDIKQWWRYLKYKIRHPSVKRHSQNMGWMFFGRIGGMAIAFVATAYMARNLGPTNYGQLSYAVSYVGLFAFLSSLGIEQILYRDLIKSPEKRNTLMGTATTLKFLSGIIAVLVCVISAHLFSSKDVSLLLIFIVSSTYVLNTFQLLSYEFQAEAKAKYPSILFLGIVFILNILRIAVIAMDQGVIFLALVILIEPLLYSIGLLYFRLKEYGTIKNWEFDLSVAKQMLKDSFPLIFASVFFSIYARIDQVMIKHMIDTTSVGLYDSAVRISELGYFIPNIIVGALFPAMINSQKQSSTLFYLRTKKLLIALVILSGLVAMTTAVFSKLFISIIYGVGFIGAVSVLQIYAWSNIGAAINLLVHQILIAENMTKIVTLTIFIGMVTNVILNFILIPRFGMAGAAYASLISYFMPSLGIYLFKPSRVLFASIFKSK